MRQNIASLVIDAETLKAIDGTLATLEKLLEDFIELSAEQRRELLKLGPKSEVFCRETLSVMERSPGALPVDFDMDAVREDREALDQVRPILSRLRMLTSRANDTEMALGSDLYKAALDGYRFAKATGSGAMLDELRVQASPLFKGNPKPKGADDASA
mgnify:CR=1 FL=1